MKKSMGSMKKGKRRGPKPEVLKLRGDWRKAVGEALKKPPMPKSEK